MYSTFSHANDAVIRVGDYVATRDPLTVQQGREGWRTQASNVFNATGGAGKHDPRQFRHVKSRLDCHLKRSSTPSSDKNSRMKKGGDSSVNNGNNPLKKGQSTMSASSVGGMFSSSGHGASTTANLLNSSPTAQLFDVDLTNATTCWKSMTRGTWLCEEERHTDLVGVVDKVNLQAETALLKVWARGENCDTGPKKQIEEVPLHLLKKLTQQEFQKKCKSKYLHDMSHQLKLRGEGYDESAPLALIAYNNRIVSSLIDRIDTSADLSKLKNMKIARPPRGIGAIRQMPIPTIVPVEDPLAEVRDELRDLAAGGGGGGKSSSASKKINSKDSNVTMKEEEELKDVRCVASRQGGPRGGGASSAMSGTRGDHLMKEIGLDQTSASLGVTSLNSEGKSPAPSGRLSVSQGREGGTSTSQQRGGGGDLSSLLQGYTSLSEDVISGAADKARSSLASRLGRMKELNSRAQVTVNAATTGGSDGPRRGTMKPEGNLQGSFVLSGSMAAGANNNHNNNSESNNSSDLAQTCHLVDVSPDGKLLFRPKAGGAMFIGVLAHLQLFVAEELASNGIDLTPIFEAAATRRRLSRQQTKETRRKQAEDAGEDFEEEDLMDEDEDESDGDREGNDNSKFSHITIDAVKALRKLKQSLFEVRLLDRHISGSSLVIAYTETGDTLQEELLTNGLAVVMSESQDTKMITCMTGSSFTKATSMKNLSRKQSQGGGGLGTSSKFTAGGTSTSSFANFGASTSLGKSLSSSTTAGGGMSLMDRLFRSQELAISQQRGLWASSDVANLYDEGESSIVSSPNSPIRSRPGTQQGGRVPAANTTSTHSSSSTKRPGGGNSPSVDDASASAATSFIDTDPSEAMAPLFTAFQSSSKFRNKLLAATVEAETARRQSQYQQQKEEEEEQELNNNGRLEEEDE